MNRYSKLLNGGNLFTVIINNKYCLCTKNSKGKIITLKKNLNYWDVMSYAYNRSIKKKIKKT